MWNKKIKIFREQAGLTQAQLGEKLGTTRECIANWELGRREPNTETFIKIAEFFNITLDDLLDAPRLSREVSDFIQKAQIYFMSNRISQEDKDKIIQDVINLYFKNKNANPVNNCDSNE